MDPGVGLVVLITLVVVVVAHSVFEKNRWLKTLQEVARRYDLSYDPGARGAEAEARGDVDGIEVVVDRHTVRTDDRSVTYRRIRVASGLASDIAFTPEGFTSFVGKVFTGEDLQVGDPEFDDKVLISGHDHCEVLAYLDPETRAEILDLIEVGTRIDDGLIQFHHTRPLRRVEDLVAPLESMLALARRLHGGGSIVERLARRVTDERIRSARRLALTHLLGRWPAHPATLDAARACLGSSFADIRLMAARHLDEDVATATLAALLDDVTLADDTRFEAAAELAHRRPEAPELTRHQPYLVARLDTPDAPAALAARAVGRFAGVDVVEALLPHTRGVFEPPEVKRAAREAISLIQSRVTGTSGALSIVEEGTARAAWSWRTSEGAG